MHWSLTFRESQPLSVATCEQALAAFVGGPVSTVFPAFRGNPRDGFFRDVSITAPHPAQHMTLVLQLRQEAWVGGDDPDATTSLGGLSIDAPTATFRTKLDTWHGLRDVFTALGCADETLVTWPSPIVDEAEAAGEPAVAARLRGEITAARVARAKRPGHYEVDLRSPRADDLEAVLDAYVDPERIVFMTLVDCHLHALPIGFARFPNLEILHLDGNPIHAGVLRGVSRPRLYMLSLSCDALTTIDREDLAGFPALRHLSVAHSSLGALDPAVVEVCPQLTQVDLRGTPLERDDARLAALRAAWPNVEL